MLRAATPLLLIVFAIPARSGTLEASIARRDADFAAGTYAGCPKTSQRAALRLFVAPAGNAGLD